MAPRGLSLANLGRTKGSSSAAPDHSSASAGTPLVDNDVRAHDTEQVNLEQNTTSQGKKSATASDEMPKPKEILTQEESVKVKEEVGAGTRSAEDISSFQVEGILPSAGKADPVRVATAATTTTPFTSPSPKPGGPASSQINGMASSVGIDVADGTPAALYGEAVTPGSAKPIARSIDASSEAVPPSSEAKTSNQASKQPAPHAEDDLLGKELPEGNNENADRKGKGKSTIDSDAAPLPSREPADDDDGWFEIQLGKFHTCALLRRFSSVSRIPLSDEHVARLLDGVLHDGRPLGLETIKRLLNDTKGLLNGTTSESTVRKTITGFEVMQTWRAYLINGRQNKCTVEDLGNGRTDDIDEQTDDGDSKHRELVDELRLRSAHQEADLHSFLQKPYNGIFQHHLADLLGRRFECTIDWIAQEDDDKVCRLPTQERCAESYGMCYTMMSKYSAILPPLIRWYNGNNDSASERRMQLTRMLGLLVRLRPSSVPLHSDFDSVQLIYFAMLISFHGIEDQQKAESNILASFGVLFPGASSMASTVSLLLEHMRQHNPWEDYDDDDEDDSFEKAPIEAITRMLAEDIVRVMHAGVPAPDEVDDIEYTPATYTGLPGFAMTQLIDAARRLGVSINSCFEKYPLELVMNYDCQDQSESDGDPEESLPYATQRIARLAKIEEGTCRFWRCPLYVRARRCLMSYTAADEQMNTSTMTEFVGRFSKYESWEYLSDKKQKSELVNALLKQMQPLTGRKIGPQSRHVLSRFVKELEKFLDSDENHLGIVPVDEHFWQQEFVVEFDIFDRHDQLFHDRHKDHMKNVPRMYQSLNCDEVQKNTAILYRAGVSAERFKSIFMDRLKDKTFFVRRKFAMSSLKSPERFFNLIAKEVLLLLEWPEVWTARKPAKDITHAEQTSEKPAQAQEVLRKYVKALGWDDASSIGRNDGTLGTLSSRLVELPSAAESTALGAKPITAGDAPAAKSDGDNDTPKSSSLASQPRLPMQATTPTNANTVGQSKDLAMKPVSAGRRASEESAATVAPGETIGPASRSSMPVVLKLPQNANSVSAGAKQHPNDSAALSKQEKPARDIPRPSVLSLEPQVKQNVPMGVQGLGSLPDATLEPQDHDTEHTAQPEGINEGNQQRGADILGGATDVGIIDQPMPDAPPDLSVEQTARAQERPVGAVESAVSPSPDEDAPLQGNDETRSVVSQSSEQKPALVTIGDNNSDEWLESLSKADLTTAFALQWDRKVLEDFPYARLQLKFIEKEIAKLENGGKDQVEDDDEDDEQNDDELSEDDDDDDAEDDDAEDDDEDVEEDVDGDVDED